jgi:hypothetical protein
MTLASELRPARLRLEQLLLDPNNPRLMGATGDLSDHVADSVALDRDVQGELQARLRQEMGLDSLIEKIKANGFLPIDRIVVRPCDDTDDMYIVLEGNRRVASLRSLKSDAIALAAMADDRRTSIEEFDVLIYEGNDPMISWSIQGLRHIEGVREWGPFQRAAFLSSLAERHGMAVTAIAKLAGLRPNVSNKLVRAYGGLRQAQQDADWGTDIGEEDFAIFHEAVFAKNHSELWKWLDWDDNSGYFRNEENLGTLLSLVKEEGEDGRPAIPRVNPDLRDHFQKLLAEPDRDRYIEQLRSGEFSLSQLTQQIAQDDVVEDLRNVQHAIDRLKSLAGAADLLPIPEILEAERASEVLASLKEIIRRVTIQIDALQGAEAGQEGKSA